MHVQLGTWPDSKGAQSSSATDGRAAGRSYPLRILVSYHYFKDEDLDATFEKHFQGLEVDCFADSGAFSAHTLGEPIDVAAYIAWVKRWQHRFSAVAGPDVIGDAAATTRETERMLAAVSGVPVLPVFHVGEPWEYLERWARSGLEYMAFGGMVPYTRNKPVLDAWVTKAFSIVPSTMRVHGFGMTTWSLLKKHPWYSVDSSSWTSGFRYAQLSLFDDQRGRFTEIKMGDPKSILSQRSLLESYGLRPADVRAHAYDRDRLCAACVDAWQRAERWLTAYKGGAMSPRDGNRVHLGFARPGRKEGR